MILSTAAFIAAPVMV